MGLSLEFSSTISSAEPNKISLRFFLSEEENYTMLFRAEFCKEETQHSQPHWHFHFLEKEQKEQKETETFEEFDKKEFEEKPKTTFISKFKDMHFSMAWQHKKGHSPDFTRQILPWMQETIERIKEEVKYVYA